MPDRTQCSRAESIDRPIIFSTPMVLALLAGRKTRTRRLAASPIRKCVPGDRLWVREAWRTAISLDHDKPAEIARKCVEAGYKTPWAPLRYEADGRTRNWSPISGAGARLRPSIHMPRWASRLTLTVTGVTIERLQEISEEDARAEGAIRYRPTQSVVAGQSLPPSEMFCFGEDPIEGTRLADAHRARAAFELLWDHLHGPGSWDANSEIVAISFTVEQRNIDAPALELANG